MTFRYTTQVPNVFFDLHLPKLTESELKILLIVIRQTNGWIDNSTGRRKIRDRISHSQFMRKTGLSRRVITKGIQSLVNRGLLNVSGFDGSSINHPKDRKGKSYIFYASTFQPVHKTTITCAQSALQPVHESAYNKTNYTKINHTKATSSSTVHIGVLLKEKNFQRHLESIHNSDRKPL